jgi:hypothetical protein
MFARPTNNLQAVLLGLVVLIGTTILRNGFSPKNGLKWSA